MQKGQLATNNVKSRQYESTKTVVYSSQTSS